MIKTLFPLFIFALCFASCGDDEVVIDPYDAELQLEIVTGLQARDSNGAPVGSYGNPNTFSGEIDIYPNPMIDQANIQYFGGAGLEVKQYWIFAADKDAGYADINYSVLLDNATYSPDEVSNLTITQTNTVNQGAFAINVDSFSPGYYRIFYLMSDNTLFWDNIYVDPTASNLTVLASEVSDDF